MNKLLFVNLLDLENLYVRSKQIGQLSLYNIVKDSGLYDVDIWDANFVYLGEKLVLHKSNRDNYKSMAEDILLQNPTYISIYTMCNNYYQALSLSKVIKKMDSTKIIILAGPQASTVAKETLESFDCIDYIAIGEGETTIIDILKFIDNRNQVVDISAKGIAYRDINGKVIVKYNNDSWCDLDNLKPLKYEVVDSQNSLIDMEIGRGCPFACTYCSTSMFWGRKYRVKSVDKVLHEIQYYKNTYDVSNFSFHHDLLTCDKKYIMELTSQMIQEKVNVNWACYSRLDVIDDEMICEMAKAGCRQIYYGIETGSNRMQKLINKNLKLDKIYSIMDSMAVHKINAEFSFIIGYPEENENDLLQTVNFIRTIKDYELEKNKKFVRIHIFPIMFFPQTKMTEETKKDLVYNPYILEENEGVNSVPVLEHELEWIKMYKDLFINYYNLPKNISHKFTKLNLFLMLIFNFAYDYFGKDMEKILQEYECGSFLDLYDVLYINKFDELMKILNYTFNDRNFNEKKLMVMIESILKVS